MDKLSELASGREWWLSVVFVGIVINLFSSLIISVIRSKFGHLVKRWAERNQKLARQREDRIQVLSKNPNELTQALIYLNQMRLDSIFEFVLAVVFISFGQLTAGSMEFLAILANVFAMLTVMTGLRSTLRWGQESVLIQDARFRASARAISEPCRDQVQQNATADEESPPG